jgi:hypothetical protein
MACTRSEAQPISNFCQPKGSVQTPDSPPIPSWTRLPALGFETSTSKPIQNPVGRLLPSVPVSAIFNWFPQT